MRLGGDDFLLKRVLTFGKKILMVDLHKIETVLQYKVKVKNTLYVDMIEKILVAEVQL